MVSLGWGSSGCELADKTWSDGASKAVSEVNVFNLRQRSVADWELSGFFGRQWRLVQLDSIMYELICCWKMFKGLQSSLPWRFRLTVNPICALQILQRHYVLAAGSARLILPVPEGQTQTSGPRVVHAVSRIYTTCIRSAKHSMLKLKVHQWLERPSKVSGCR